MSIPYVKLLYTSAAIRDFPVAEILAGTRRVTPDDYLLTLSIPIMEMTAKEPVNMMEELMAMTASAEWQGQFRRSPACGDIMRYDTDHWMLVKKSDIKHLAIADTNFIILPERKTYAIVLIPQSQIDGDLCNQMALTT